MSSSPLKLFGTTGLACGFQYAKMACFLRYGKQAIFMRSAREQENAPGFGNGAASPYEIRKETKSAASPP